MLPNVGNPSAGFCDCDPSRVHCHFHFLSNSILIQNNVELVHAVAYIVNSGPRCQNCRGVPRANCEARGNSNGGYSKVLHQRIAVRYTPWLGKIGHVLAPAKPARL